MKYITMAILWLLLATPALSCVLFDDVDAEGVDSLPVLGYVQELSSQDSVTFMIYIRETGNFEGLTGVSSEVRDAEGSEIFRGALLMSPTDQKGLFRVSLIIGKKIMEQGAFTVTAEKTDRAERKTEDGTTVESVHSTIYIYKFNLKMLYLKYKANSLFKHSQQDKYHGYKLDSFLKKKFEKDRDCRRKQDQSVTS